LSERLGEALHDRVLETIRKGPASDPRALKHRLPRGVVNSVVAQQLGRDEAEHIGSKLRESLEPELRERIAIAAQEGRKDEVRERVPRLFTTTV